MKKLSILFSILVACCFVCLGCGGNPPPAEDDGFIYRVNGFGVESVETFMDLNGYYATISIKNTNKESGIIDLSKLEIKCDGQRFNHVGYEEYFEAQESRSLTLYFGDYGISTGDLVLVYYNSDLVAEVVMENRA